MINVINDETVELHTWLCKNNIPNDGFIITPLSGNREIKK